MSSNIIPIPLIDFSVVKKKRFNAKNDDLSTIILTPAIDPSSNDRKSVEKAKGTIEPNFDYDELLDRIYEMIKKNNPEMMKETKLEIPYINVIKAGSTRYAWTNFEEVCKSFNRPLDHMKAYILKELGTEGSLGAENQLLLKGRQNSSKIENFVIKYFKEYVKCSNCKSSKTILEKDTQTKLKVLKCITCGCTKTVGK